MIELNAPSFLGAATSLARIHQIFSGLSAANDEKLIPESISLILPAVRLFEGETQAIGARLASVSAHRFMASLEQSPCDVTVGKATIALHDIESRFADYLSEIKLFTLSSQESPFMSPADDLLQNSGFSILFPSASFEVEEAAKCIAFGRYTASVFHAMRMLEIGIRALSKRLGIPDPTKPSEKNWGKILTAIKAQIDQLWPTNSRLPGSEGVAFEGLYAHLDAVRNPWRNSTMHVETIYAPHEALHIIRCAAFFMTALSKLTDEDGTPPHATPSLQLAGP
ncbi:hypothetical protein GVM20_12485 [Porphyrobacter sp. SLTP]|uniref:hypothetical protein n=1 Tax=Porphyrobacter sp. SLTP TaxID=2683266 RepID=UPI001412123D|nr:hypothetical protein [Porphyrobacter sp. SLTP]NBB25945.1 hypothetical protein [Porphyrobacter sp. SLTP]